MEHVVRSVIVDGAGGSLVKEISGRVQCFSPKGRCKVGLDKKGTYDVVSGAKKSFCLAILGLCMRTREAAGNPIRGEESTEGGVDELTAVVAL